MRRGNRQIDFSTRGNAGRNSGVYVSHNPCAGANLS